MSMFLFYTNFLVINEKICKKTKSPIILFKPYISPKKRNNPNYHQYMVFTLLAYSPFSDRESIISRSEQDLEKTFNEFLDSNICPFYVKKRHQKLNKKRKNITRNKEREIFTSQDEIEDEQLSNSSSEESSSEESDFEDEFHQDMPANYQEQGEQSSKTEINQEPNELYQIPPIAEFTEQYQEYGHMAPKGLVYDGEGLSFFDDDSDTLEIVKCLSDDQDKIFDPSKDSWQPKHPLLINPAIKAQEILKQKPSIKDTSQYLDPNDLDPTQTLFLDTVLQWERQCIECKQKNKPFPPLKVKLLGVAGTGKSRTIKTLVQEFKKEMQKSDLPENEHGKILLCAPTGVAAFNIGCGAASVHKTFNIPVRGNFNDLTGEKQKQLEEDFENVWLIIIDEISMVGCEMLAKVNDRLIQAKLNENGSFAIAQKDLSLKKPAFGGLGMVLCGDFGQLIPIMQHSLMDNERLPISVESKETKKKYTNKGKDLIDQFKISIILSKQHRQNKGKYNEICLTFRDGSFNTEHHKELQKKRL